MRALKTLCGLCGLILLLALPAGAAAESGPGQALPEECTFEAGEMGRYIVVFHDWVADPEALAREQVSRFGGSLGSVYGSALKGYSARFLPASAEALQAEPSVQYVEVDQLIWMDESSGDPQRHSCPGAPPLGPAPSGDPAPAPTDDAPAPADPAPAVAPEPPAPSRQPAIGLASPQARSSAGHCRGKARKGRPCRQKRGAGHRGTCRKHNAARRFRCSRGA